MSLLKHSLATRRRRKRLTNKAHFERLEDRRLLAGDVLVAVNNGSIFVRGDVQDNQVEIRQYLGDRIEITGLDGTTINGQESETVPLGVPNGLRVHMGQGDDMLMVDTLVAAGRSIVYGGPGNDSIGFYEVQIGDLVVQTFSGDDTISLDQVIVDGKLRVIGHDGNDTIGLRSTYIYDDGIVVAGAGNDKVAVNGAVFFKDAMLLTQDGNDYLGATNMGVGGVGSFYTGRGNDDVFLNKLGLNNDARTSGQQGVDNYWIGGTNSDVNVYASGYEGELFQGFETIKEVNDEMILSGVRLGTVTDLARLTPQLSTLYGALQTTGLDSSLNRSNVSVPLTVFAPLNSAFESLPPGTLEGLTVTELTDILKFHVSEGDKYSDEIGDLDRIYTILGGAYREYFTVDATADGIVLNGNVEISIANIRAKNGVVHVVDAVLLVS